MNDEECPCIDCICVAICKHKPYEQLINCESCFEYLYPGGFRSTPTTLDYDEYKKRLKKIAAEFKNKVVYVTSTSLISQKGTFGSE